MTGIRVHKNRFLGSTISPERCTAGILCVCFMLVLTFPGQPAYAQSFSTGAFVDSSVSPNEYIRRNLDKFITPEYLKRHDRMRFIQREGYALVLTDVVRRDPLAALIDFLRMSLHLDYSQNLGPVYYPSQTRVWFELPVDRSYPEDPWKKDWWRK